MKKILLAFVFGMITLSVFPQKKVSFLDNEPWEKVLKQAQKAQKMVFVDCYTSWCVPCKHLMNVIFPQKIVSDYLDSMFVCVKYDIEKENGKAFEDQYPNKILAVPTMFVTDSHGNLLHVLRGAREADDLLDNLKKGLLGKPLYEIEKEYRQGNRELDLVKRYLWFLNVWEISTTMQRWPVIMPLNFLWIAYGLRIFGVWWEVTFGEIHIVGNFVSSLNIWKNSGK